MTASRSLIDTIGAGLVALALPPRCPGCGTVTDADHRFCGSCWQQLDFLDGPGCAGCGAPFVHDLGAGARCGQCLKDPPAIDGARAAIAYGAIARHVALRLKYGRRPGLAVTAAKLMRRAVVPGEDVLLVPVPLHRWRIWWRGYNQSALIATALARETGLPTLLDALVRHKATPVLRGLGPAARRQTLRGAFRVPPERRSAVAGRSILLVDDVYTTGATVNACARVLKQAGAASVHVLCWARVVPDNV